MTAALTPYQPAQRAGRAGFWQVLRSEWTKFRTVTGWVVGMLVAGFLVVLFAVLTGASTVAHSDGGAVPVGPGGEPVVDSFYFAHQSLDGDGAITVSVSSLTDSISSNLRPGVVPWAKAGLILKANTTPGSPYAAIMVTSSHGVRMQDNYINDTAGLPGPATAAAPRWLRLVRAGDSITGYDSADGTHWSAVGTVRLAGLEATVQGGLFVASPPSVQGGGTVSSVSTATFGSLSPQGQWSGGSWAGEQVGAASRSFAGYPRSVRGGYTQSGDHITVTGAGDIAPATREDLGSAGVISDLLIGTFAALIAVIVVATLFITAEYRQSLIHVTLAASPRRGRVLAAKGIVLGVVTFVAGFVGAVIAVPLGERLARAKGVYLFPASSGTQLQAELGTAAVLAVAAILALAVGTMFRRSAGAVTTVVAAIVLPYILVATPFMPGTVSDWLTRVTPAAAFAVQQTLTPYPQVDSVYLPANGYYPLAPWAGFAVLCGYTVLALIVAAILLRRRDA